MRRRRNPYVTFVMFLGLLAFVGASYQFLWVEKIWESSEANTPLASAANDARAAVERALADEPCFRGITNWVWRSNESFWRVDVDLGDNCREDAKRIARHVADVVRRATGGQEACVFCYILGAEVYHLLP
jgi:hypothetical protein